MQRLAILFFGSLLLTSATVGQTLPRQSPEYAVQRPEGGQLLLSSLRGKPVVIEFLLTTCPHCQVTAGALQKVHDQFAAKNLEVIGVAVNEGATARDIVEFRRISGAKFPIGLPQTRDSVAAYLQKSVMERLSYPQVLFIDRKGMIRSQYMGGEGPLQQRENQEQKLREEVEKQILSAPAPPKRLVSSAAKKAAH